ncbi:hypothetical protein TBLA_0E01205 [Henningerozyma blattae CBS 6284]|uniref:PITH domain-containing protein n=1 Tax=Henningerozyma blattae (strain ATCC 34711 / CBS 6284 / DSM 70876 / NBRC 10599 / NRRL Y-10934 / UCD 77-7) TaxID=1071380 RepID=I2H478_HENB6|nr:hypothetical protein TBLA_0E01205 [Tetrapisispora blattae CBS 6284]CCH61180.1 hypothetical protein TBLA_0E01205 [Tetrapisispora blattae CBS 6284]
MSHHCEDEHHSHSNSHGHGHSHSHQPPIPTNPQQSLYQYIDTAKICILNGKPIPTNATPSVSTFLKNQDHKFVCNTYLETDSDCQLIIHLPFIGNCKIYSIIIRNNSDNLSNDLSTPKKVRLFKNFNKTLHFDTITDSKEDYSIECPKNIGITTSANDLEINTDENTFVEHYLPRNQFQNTNSLTIFWENNWSDDEDLLLRLYYLEIRGEFLGISKARSTVPGTLVYESAPNPADHVSLENDKEHANLGM